MALLRPGGSSGSGHLIPRAAASYGSVSARLPYPSVVTSAVTTPMKQQQQQGGFRRSDGGRDSSTLLGGGGGGGGDAYGSGVAFGGFGGGGDGGGEVVAGSEGSGGSSASGSAVSGTAARVFDPHAEQRGQLLSSHLQPQQQQNPQQQTYFRADAADAHPRQHVSMFRASNDASAAASPTNAASTNSLTPLSPSDTKQPQPPRGRVVAAASSALLQTQLSHLTAERDAAVAVAAMNADALARAMREVEQLRGALLSSSQARQGEQREQAQQPPL